MISFILGDPEPTAQEIINNDLNNDGELNIVDVIMLINIILDADED